MMKRLFFFASMRSNHTQQRKVSTQNLFPKFLCVSAPLSLRVGSIPIGVFGHGSLQQQQQKQKRSAVTSEGA